MPSRDLKVTLIGEDRTKGAFSSASSGASGLTKKFGGIGKSLAFAVGGAAVGGIAGIAAAMVQGVKDAASYQQITDQLAQTLKSTGGAAGVSVDQLKQYAAQLESMSGVDEELILSSQNVLATFTNIRNSAGQGNDIFNQASQAALNLSTTMGGDLQGASVLVGKALNDPIKGVTALSRAGVQLTQAQKDSIKAMVASGDAAGAQKIILGELETQFGGAAAAAGEGLTGSIARAKDAFSDMFRTLAENLLPILATVAEWVAVKLPLAFAAIGAAWGTVVAFFRSGSDEAGASVGGFRDKIAAVVTFAQTTFETLKTIFFDVVTVITALWSAFGDSLIRFATAAFAAIGQVISGALDIIKGVLDVFIGVFTGDWSRAWDGIKEIVSGAWTVIKGLFDAAWAAIQLSVNLAWTAISAVFSAAWTGIKTGVSDAWTAIKGYFSEAWTALIASVTAGWNSIKELFTGAWSAMKATVGDAWAAMKTATTDAIEAIIGFVEGIPAKVATALVNFGSGLFQLAQSAFGKFGEAESAGIAAIVTLVEAIPGKIKTALGDLGGLLKAAGKAVIDGFIDGIESVFGRVKDTLGKLTSLLPDWKGPASRDAMILRGSGQLVMAGFEQGLRDQFGSIRQTLGDATDLLSLNMPGGSARAQAALAGRTGPVERVPLTAPVDRTDEMLALLAEQNELLRRLPREYQLGQRQGG